MVNVNQMDYDLQDESSVKWTVLAYFGSQPCEQKFPSPNLVDRSSPLQIPTPWANFPNPNLVDRSGPPYTRFNKIPRNIYFY